MIKKNCFLPYFVMLFTAVFAISFSPAAALPVQAAGITVSLPGVVGGTLTFDESTGTVTACSPNVTSAEIPAEINGIPVLELGGNAFASCKQLTGISFSEGLIFVPFGAFSGCSALERVSFPASLEFLDKWAFLDCPSLKTIEIAPQNETYTVLDNILYTKDQKTLLFCSAGRDTPVHSIPDRVERIDQNAFAHCVNLTDILLPSSLREIGIAAFSGCPIREITFPATLEKIEDYAFQDCSALNRITIPENVTEIGYGAFSNCASLQTLSVSQDNLAYTSIDDILYTKDEKTLLLCPAGQTRTDRSIPSSVEKIESLAFYRCRELEQIAIPSGVTEIGNTAFSGCSALKSITLPPTVTTCGASIFSFCSSLETVNFLASVPALEHQMFQSCSSLTTVTLSGTIKKIDWEAFGNCNSLSTLVYRGTEEAWNSVVIESNGNKILQTAELVFQSSPLVEVSLPGVVGGTLTFDESTGAIVGCSDNVTSAQIPPAINGITVTEIGNGAFTGCEKLWQIQLPESVTTIADAAFSGCTALESITIPKSVTVIDPSAFASCKNLSQIVYQGTEADWNQITDSSGNTGSLNGLPVVFPDPEPKPETKKYILGDVDKNGKVEIKDKVLSSRYLAKWKINENFDKRAADFNNDGNVTAAEVVVIARYLAKWKNLPYPIGIWKTVE